MLGLVAFSFSRRAAFDSSAGVAAVDRGHGAEEAADTSAEWVGSSFAAYSWHLRAPTASRI